MQPGSRGLGWISICAVFITIYNHGNASAADLVWVIAELKRRVRERFGFEIEEEVQYVGF